MLTLKGDPMYLILTRDRMLFQGIACLTGPDNTVLIQREEDICPDRYRHAVVIIDSLKNNIFHSALSTRLQQTEPRHIFVMSPFGIKNCLGDTEVKFIPRTLHPTELRRRIINGVHFPWRPEIYLTRRQHQVMSTLLTTHQTRDTCTEMNIMMKTFYSHKYDVMNLFGVRRLNKLLKHPCLDYLRSEQ
ncbi:helix-turn-helix transcriptional regulator [Enterobacter asburiae]|uniref:helix-turn-helix transcriptional regulator n=1 Tax=Enterobacter asburiae TaxID=61645 RepID=UPI003F42D101